MSYNRILFAEEEGIALITVSRPEKLNALNRDVLAELDDAFHAAAADGAVRGIVLTGAGEKAFVAGADIKELSELTAAEAQALALRGQAVFTFLESCGKPSIAAINGFALGGGLELALACNLRVASPNAKLGQPEVKLGLIPGYGGTQRLPRLVGRGKALEMLLTGEPVTAEEAWRIGLVNHVVPQPELLGFARGLMRKMVVNGPVALKLAAEAVRIGLDCGMDQASASRLRLSPSRPPPKIPRKEPGRSWKSGTRNFLENEHAESCV